MEPVHLGTQYGGWYCFPDLLPDAGLVIDAGIGTDLSFSRALKDLKPGLRFVGIDHTDDSARWVKHVAIPDFHFIQAALAGGAEKTVKMHRHKTSGSESIFKDHNFVNPEATYDVPAVSLSELVSTYKPDLVKLDIEGAEYEVWPACLGVTQVCIEFHHRMMSAYSEKDTEQIIQAFLSSGYTLVHRTPTDEVLLVWTKALK